MQWLVEHMPERREHTRDVLLCPGDISDRVEVLSEALKTLRARFDEVCFTAGNHDLWVPPAARFRPSLSALDPFSPKPPPPPPPPHEQFTSLDQLERVMATCDGLRVRTTPLWIRAASASERDVCLVPLHSWYHESWDREPELPVAAGERVRDYGLLWADTFNCRWPESLCPPPGHDGSSAPQRSIALAERFARLNEAPLSRVLSQLPPRPAAGRPPPAERLSKEATYARLGAAPRGSPALWTSVDPSTFFTRRAIDAFEAEAAAASVDVSDAGAPTEEERPPAERPPAERPPPPLVVSLSHFVPRQELLPEKRLLFHPFLHKVSGSAPLERQVRKLMPDIHVFGHTHLNIDKTIDGVRYVQWPLGTPREQAGQTRPASLGMLCLYDSAHGGEAPQHWTHWGRHYEEYERDLTRTARPPYVTNLTSRLAAKSGGGAAAAAAQSTSRSVP